MRAVKVSLPLPMAAGLLSAIIFLAVNFIFPLRSLPDSPLFSLRVPQSPSSPQILSTQSTASTSSSTSSPPSERSYPHGHIHPLLHSQNLSHRALHSPLRLHLSALFRPRAVAVIGVEFGGDVLSFAAAGYRVHAVEPGVKYANRLSSFVAKNPALDVHVYPFAATERSHETLSIDNQKERVATNVQTRRLDHLVKERLAVLSVDVQGGEPTVLKGASNLLPNFVDSLVVEISGCYKQTLQVMKLLDDHYVLFDFVPRGDANPRGRKGHEDFRHMYKRERPSKFEMYDKWLCDRSNGKLRWVQTDLLAVRRDLVDGVWEELSTLGTRYCGKQGIFCTMTPV